VAWIFTQKAYFAFDKDKVDQDNLLNIALEADVEDIDIETDEKNIETTLPPTDFEKFKKILSEHHIEYSIAELTMIPQTTIDLEGKKAVQMLSLMEQMEDHDDVQNVYANFNIDEKVMEGLTSE